MPSAISLADLAHNTSSRVFVKASTHPQLIERRCFICLKISKWSTREDRLVIEIYLKEV